MICENIKLGGHLVKWVLKKKDGRTYERNCKIHNTITKSCLNNLLEFNGPGSVVPNNSRDYSGANLWVTASGTNGRYGVFNSCALGNGTGETSVDDTALKNKVGTYTTTKWNGYCGSSRSYSDNKLTIRISHVHTITDNFTIKEIGWFNRIYPDGEYSLSARVQLDNFVNVDVGDIFYTVYEIILQFPKPHNITVPILGKAITLQKLYVYSNVSGQIFPWINPNGEGDSPLNGGRNDGLLSFPSYRCDSISDYNLFSYLTSDSAVVESLNSNPYYTNQNTLIEKSVKTYTLDSFYRDYEISVPALYVNIYTLCINGCILRLGEYDENNNFVPNPYYMDKALKFTLRQRWSTDLLTPAG